MSPTGRAKKLYSEAVNTNVEKRFKLLVKSKHNQTTDEIKNTLRTSVNPKAIRVGISSFKSMKGGRVFIEAGTQEEIKLLSSTITEKCGEDMEVTIPKLRKPRLIIHNVPQDITVENLEETILAQNPELNMATGDTEARYTHTDTNTHTAHTPTQTQHPHRHPKSQTHTTTQTQTPTETHTPTDTHPHRLKTRHNT